MMIYCTLDIAIRWLNADDDDFDEDFSNFIWSEVSLRELDFHYRYENILFIKRISHVHKVD